MTHPLDASWSLGVLIGGPILIVLVVLGILAIAFGVIVNRDPDPDGGAGGGLIFGGSLWIAVVLLCAAAPGIGYYPYDAEYHQWRDKAGTVSQIDKRIYGSSGVEEKFVVRFEGSSQQYGCDDTRCASVREGDRLALSCKRAWQYTGTDGYDCRYVGSEPASG